MRKLLNLSLCGSLVFAGFGLAGCQSEQADVQDAARKVEEEKAEGDKEIGAEVQEKAEEVGEARKDLAEERADVPATTPAPANP